MNFWSVDSLIGRMRTRGYLPQSLGLTTPQLLELLTDEAGLYVVALLKSIREEFLMAETDVTAVSGSLVAIPTRAAGAAFRTIGMLESGKVRWLDRYEPEARPSYATTGTPTGFIFNGNSVELVPAAGGTVRVRYQRRPGRLVLEASAAEVVSVDTGTGVVTVLSLPTTITATTPCDFVRGTANFDARAIDKTPTSINTATPSVTFATAELPSGLAAGDFVCLAGQTCMPPFVQEMHPVLALRTALVLAEAAGSDRAAGLRRQLEGTDGEGGLRAEVINLLSPRADGSARPVIRHGGPARTWW